MQKLEKEEKLFGTPAVTNAWVSAIAHHPVAYLEHRSAFMWNFLAGSNLTMWLIDVNDSMKTPVSGSPRLCRGHDNSRCLKTDAAVSCRHMVAALRCDLRVWLEQA